MSEENKYTFENEEYRKTYWHTCSHVLAQAVKRLWRKQGGTVGLFKASPLKNFRGEAFFVFHSLSAAPQKEEFCHERKPERPVHL